MSPHENENKPSRKVINFLYLTDILLIGSLDKHFISHSHGNIDFIVSSIGCVLVALVLTALMIRYLPSKAVTIAVPTTIFISILIDVL